MSRLLKNKPLIITIIVCLLVIVALALAMNTRKPKKRHHIVYYPPFDHRRMVLDNYWLQAKLEVDRNVMDLLAQDKRELSSGLRLHKFMSGDPRKKVIALTIDDGPHPEFTPKILKILDENGVKATFFVVGRMAENYPELVRAEEDAGHEIGNHTYDHLNLTELNNEDIATEIESCGDVIKSITGERPHLFRPPGGDYDRDVAIVSEALGYTMVLWSDDTGDWDSPGESRIDRHMLRNVSNGGVILIHDGIPQTLDVLPRLIVDLKKRGYQFVTVDQLMPASARSTREADLLKKS